MDEFKELLADMDTLLRSLPATAQVARALYSYCFCAVGPPHAFAPACACKVQPGTWRCRPPRMSGSGL